MWGACWVVRDSAGSKFAYFELKFESLAELNDKANSKFVKRKHLHDDRATLMLIFAALLTASTKIYENLSSFRESLKVSIHNASRKDETLTEFLSSRSCMTWTLIVVPPQSIKNSVPGCDDDGPIESERTRKQIPFGSLQKPSDSERIEFQFFSPWLSLASRHKSHRNSEGILNYTASELRVMNMKRRKEKLLRVVVFISLSGLPPCNYKNSM